MIAPAMNTRSDEALPVRDLARQKARISRQISLQQLPRVALLAADDSGAVFNVTLLFTYHPDGYIRISGQLEGALTLDCNGCAETADFPLGLEFSCAVAMTEDQAIELGTVLDEGDDLVIAEGEEISVTEIVEDEILLNLPERLCTAEPCERAPVMHYPAEDRVATVADEVPSENPFSILQELKGPDR